MFYILYFNTYFKIKEYIYIYDISTIGISSIIFSYHIHFIIRLKYIKIRISHIYIYYYIYIYILYFKTPYYIF